MTDIAERALSISTIHRLVTRCMEVKQPCFIWGPPGIGKSELIEGIGFEQNRPVIDMRLLLLEPTDIKGIPYYDTSTASLRWAKPVELPGENEVDLHNAILFLDELNAAPPAVQAAAYQLILNRRVGEYRLPDGVSIVAAGNRDGDKGVTFRMPSPLRNRLMHFEMEVNFKDWQKWAIANNIDADIVGFLSHHKSKLFTFDPKSKDRAFATPRSWVMVHRTRDKKLDDSDNTAIVAGAVGQGTAIEFAQHCRISGSLPKPEAVLTGKTTTLSKKAAKEISAKFSLAISLCYTLKDMLKDVKDDEVDYTIKDWHVNVDYFFRFVMDNFTKEMVVLSAKTALRDYNLPIKQGMLKNFKQFHNEYGEYITGD